MLAAANGDGAEPVRDGQIITVFAAKGGCGKTTLAVNLGVVLARDDRLRVCIVDLDLAFGDVAISMQADPARTVVDALPMAGHLDTTGAASLLTHYRPGLDLLLAPVTPGDAEKIPPSLVGELLAVLQGMFDYVVIDTPPAFSEHVLTAMDASDHHVLVTTPDVLAVKNLRVALDTLDLLSYSRQTRSVILNRSDSRVRLSPEDVERGIRTQLAARLPSSRAVPACINKGVPIVRDSPRHAVSQAIARFAEQHLLPQPEPTKPRHRRGRKGPS
jgi:pilus assembly protein CpaE